LTINKQLTKALFHSVEGANQKGPLVVAIGAWGRAGVAWKSQVGARQPHWVRVAFWKLPAVSEGIEECH